MQVKDAMRKLPETIETYRTIAEAAQQMDHAAVGALVVVDQGHPVGIVTDRDLVVRALGRHVSLDARVDSVMSMGLIALDVDVDLRQAIKTWRKPPARWPHRCSSAIPSRRSQCR